MAASEPAPEPDTCDAGLFDTLIWICEPVIVISPDALSPNVCAAYDSSCCPEPLSFSVVPSLSALECMITFCFALTSMSPSHSILTSLFAESRTILFFFVLSTIVTVSLPSLSSKITR